MLNFPRIITFFINLAKKSLQIELNGFMSFLRLPNVTKQAISKARMKLSPKAFSMLNDELVNEFYTDNDIAIFKGYRVLAVDGSTVPLPNSNELIEKFGIQKGRFGEGFPFATISVLFDVMNKITLHAEIASYKTSEKRLAIKHLKYLQKTNSHTNDLLLFDRGYPSTEIMFLLQFQNRDFLMRCGTGFRSDINDAVELGKSDQIITLPALRKNRKPKIDDIKKTLPHLDKKSSMQLRILMFTLKTGEKEVLLTSLLDKNTFPPSVLFDLYAKRWDVEENYKFHKAILEMENFTGKSEISVQQDFHATILTSNMASLLIQEAEAELKMEQNNKKLKYKYKINKNISIGLLKNELINLLLNDDDLDDYCEKLKNKIKKNLIPIRPNRSFSRSRNKSLRYHQNRRRSI